MTKRIAEFDLWRPGYGNANVAIYLPGTTTLAAVFEDEALTVPADNPQILAAKSHPDGTTYGKFEKPLYTGSSYFLSVDGIENTGIVRPPFSSLIGEDASGATVTAAGSSYPVPLEKIVALSVNVALYGEFVAGSSGVAATNTATLALAIAALTNGGEVHIPSGTYQISGLELPQGVVLVGDSRESTILQSIMGAVTFTIVGDRAGFKNITLDGNSLSENSVGIRSVGNDEITFDSVMIRRFETGIHFLGGKGHVWNDFSIENTQTGAKLHGDMDAGNGSGGGNFADLVWTGGLVSVGSGIGLSLSYEDTVCHNIVLSGVGFEDCLGIGTVVNGAQSVQFIGCWWRGNTVNIDIHDDSLVMTTADEHLNDIINLSLNGGRMEGGIVVASGTLQNVVLSDMKLESVTFNLVTPIDNFLLVQDCFEDTGIVITGETTKFLRSTTTQNGASFGLSTTTAAVKAWSMTLHPGQMVYLEGKVIARGRNVAQRAIYHISCGAYMEGATLNYDTQTSNFTVGTVLTGQTSGATARIQADTDSGTTGVLTLVDIKGAFLDNELIADNGDTPGGATVNGVLSVPTVSLDTVGVTNLRTAYETDSDWNATFAANQQEIELRVQGDSSQTVEWSVHVDVVAN